MKLSFKTRFGFDGTVYKQTISITPRELQTLQNAIQAERATGFPFRKEYEESGMADLFLKPLNQIDKFVYINHTQTRFCNRFLKMPIKSYYNTCLLIKK